MPKEKFNAYMSCSECGSYMLYYSDVDDRCFQTCQKCGHGVEVETVLEEKKNR